MGEILVASVIVGIVAVGVAGMIWAVIADHKESERQGSEDSARIEQWARALEGASGIIEGGDLRAATEEAARECEALDEVLRRHAKHRGTHSALRELRVRIRNAVGNGGPTPAEARGIIESVRRVAETTQAAGGPAPAPPSETRALARPAPPRGGDAQAERVARKAEGIRQIAHQRLGAGEIASTRIEGYTATIAESVERNCREIALAREAGAMIEGENAQAELRAFEHARREENERLLKALEEAGTRLVKMENGNGDGAVAGAALAALTRALESAPPRALAPSGARAPEEGTQ